MTLRNMMEFRQKFIKEFECKKIDSTDYFIAKGKIESLSEIINEWIRLDKLIIENEKKTYKESKACFFSYIYRNYNYDNFNLNNTIID